MNVFDGKCKHIVVVKYFLFIYYIQLSRAMKVKRCYDGLFKFSKLGTRLRIISCNLEYL